MEFIKRIRHHTFIVEICFLLGLTCIILPVILPYLHSGYFPTHDGEWAVVRLTDMFRSIKDLQFPVRYSGSLNFGYGYPLFNFAYPMPYYIGLFFVFLKFGFVGSIKAVFVLSILSGALGMYLLSKSVFISRSAGIVSAVLYTYMPYHLVDLFVRGSIGESVAFGIFPYILLFVYKLFSGNNKLLYSVLSGIFLGLLIPSHNIMAVLFMPVLFVFVISLYYSKKRIHPLYFFLILLIGFGLSAFFFIPALVEKNNILLSLIPIADRSLYFVHPLDLFFSPFGYGTPTDSTPFTYQVGIPLLLGFGVVLFLLIQHFERNKLKRGEVLLVGLSCLTLIFIMLLFSPSKLIWNNVPLLNEINYPWTLLSQIGLILSFLIGYLFTQKKVFSYIGVGLAVLIIAMYMQFAKPYEYIDKGDVFYMTNPATTTSSNELMPLWVKTHPTSQVGEKVQILQGEGSISHASNSSDYLEFNSHLASDSAVVINTIYYPGWVAKIDGKNIPIMYENEQGVMQISVPKGSQHVVLQLTETPIRIVANILSLITLVCVSAILLLLFFKKYRHSHAK